MLQKKENELPLQGQEAAAWTAAPPPVQIETEQKVENCWGFTGCTSMLQAFSEHNIRVTRPVRERERERCWEDCQQTGVRCCLQYNDRMCMCEWRAGVSGRWNVSANVNEFCKVMVVVVETKPRPGIKCKYNTHNTMHRVPAATSTPRHQQQQ